MARVESSRPVAPRRHAIYASPGHPARHTGLPGHRHTLVAGGPRGPRRGRRRLRDTRRHGRRARLDPQGCGGPGHQVDVQVRAPGSRGAAGLWHGPGGRREDGRAVAADHRVHHHDGPRHSVGPPPRAAHPVQHLHTRGRRLVHLRRVGHRGHGARDRRGRRRGCTGHIGHLLLQRAGRGPLSAAGQGHWLQHHQRRTLWHLRSTRP